MNGILILVKFLEFDGAEISGGEIVPDMACKWSGPTSRVQSWGKHPQKRSPARFPLRSPRAGHRNPSAEEGVEGDAAAGTEMSCAALGMVTRSHAACSRSDSPDVTLRAGGGVCAGYTSPRRQPLTSVVTGRGEARPVAAEGRARTRWASVRQMFPSASLPLLVHTTTFGRACFGARRMPRAWGRAVQRRGHGQLDGTFLSLQGRWNPQAQRPSSCTPVLRPCGGSDGSNPSLKMQVHKTCLVPSGFGGITGASSWGVGPPRPQF